MNHKFLLSLITSIICAMSIQAQVMQKDNNGVYTINSGNAVMTVDCQRGGKITSLTLDGKELIAQHKKIEGMPFENFNDYGSTFWPSPQSTWNWPPIATYDSKPYKAEVNDKKLILTSGKDEKYPYIFKKTFLPIGSGKYSITYTIINNSDTAVSVAPWEITRVPSGGEIFFEASSIRPDNEVEYTQEKGIIHIPFVPVARKNRKIFADAKGWLCFADNGLLFKKTFADITHEQAAPGEDEVEIYRNFGTTYTEIENQGAFVTIQPKQEHSWNVLWEIANK
ncbi:MAG: hypothetical protein HUK06_04430 [Bacteroidaceae bacterium]|nr:hypothetical protein [Bacteroidaceae bacterium]